jgi:hypothetical protein
MVGWNSVGGNDFDIDPRNANRILGVGGASTSFNYNGIYLSTNKGGSWSHVKVFSDAEGGDVEFDESSYDAGLGYCRVAYFASHGGGLWKSTDGGANWTKINDGFSGTRIKVHPTRGFVYAASNNYGSQGLWKSTDGGLNFTRKYDNYVRGLDVISTRPENVYISSWAKVAISTNGGDTFGYIGTNWPPTACPKYAPRKHQGEPGQPEQHAGVLRRRQLDLVQVLLQQRRQHLGRRHGPLHQLVHPRQRTLGHLGLARHRGQHGFQRRRRHHYQEHRRGPQLLLERERRKRPDAGRHVQLQRHGPQRDRVCLPGLQRRHLHRRRQHLEVH